MIDAAMRIVAKEGASSLSLRAVAKDIDVSSAAPYHHFKDKQALLGAIVGVGLKQFNRALTKAAKKASSPDERLRDLGVAYVVFATENPNLFELIQKPDFARDGAPGHLAEEREENFRILFETISACMPNASESQLRTGCAAAWGLVHGIAVLAIDHRLNAVMPYEDLGSAMTELIEQISFAKAIGREIR
ncbi:MAG: TetR/AcrR family transcriptional regulator [Woeseiaceae bacterium]|nr:TetR/AcrR family transcriptional regulator [Woeseiaceae bacterium]